MLQRLEGAATMHPQSSIALAAALATSAAAKQGKRSSFEEASRLAAGDHAAAFQQAAAAAGATGSPMQPSVVTPFSPFTLPSGGAAGSSGAASSRSSRSSYLSGIGRASDAFGGAMGSSGGVSARSSRGSSYLGNTGRHSDAYGGGQAPAVANSSFWQGLPDMSQQHVQITSPNCTATATVGEQGSFGASPPAAAAAGPVVSGAPVIPQSAGPTRMMSRADVVMQELQQAALAPDRHPFTHQVPPYESPFVTQRQQQHQFQQHQQQQHVQLVKRLQLLSQQQQQEQRDQDEERQQQEQHKHYQQQQQGTLAPISDGLPSSVVGGPKMLPSRLSSMPSALPGAMDALAPHQQQHQWPSARGVGGGAQPAAAAATPAATAAAGIVAAGLAEARARDARRSLDNASYAGIQRHVQAPEPLARGLGGFEYVGMVSNSVLFGSQSASPADAASASAASMRWPPAAAVFREPAEFVTPFSSSSSQYHAAAAAEAAAIAAARGVTGASPFSSTAPWQGPQIPQPAAAAVFREPAEFVTPFSSSSSQYHAAAAAAAEAAAIAAARGVTVSCPFSSTAPHQRPHTPPPAAAAAAAAAPHVLDYQPMVNTATSKAAPYPSTAAAVLDAYQQAATSSSQGTLAAPAAHMPHQQMQPVPYQGREGAAGCLRGVPAEALLALSGGGVVTEPRLPQQYQQYTPTLPWCL